MRVLLVGDVDDAQIIAALPGAAVARDVANPDAIVRMWDGTPLLGGAPTVALLRSPDEAQLVAALRAGARDAVSLARLDRLAPALAAAVRADNQTRISEARFRSLWDSEILLVTITGSGGTILEANPGFLRTLGYTLDELRAHTWAELTPEKWAATDEVARQQLLAGEARPWRKEIYAKDGRAVPLLASAVLLPGSPPQALAFAIDLSEQVRIADANRELEAQLRQAQKLEAIGTLAGGVAHDFNNLLSVMIGYAEMLRDGASDEQRADIEEILDAADRAKALTAQLLAFGRRQVLQPRVLQLDELVARALPMLRRLVPASIELATRLAPATVRADPNQLEQVLMNLVINARDAIGARGSIAIAVSDGEGARLSVSDTGAGMDEETRARIFEPFFTTKAQGKGTGLGLSTVFGIVQQSGGTIDVASAPGCGTTFTIVLPSAAGVPAPAPPRTSTKKLRGSEIVLTCEDEPQLRTLVHAVLTRHGYRVLSASSGEEALALATAGIDLLVTDVVMPGMSGRDLAERLRAEDPALKVIYMSGYTDDELVHTGVSEASVAFLQKPIHPDELARKVRDVLDGRA